MEGYSVDGCVFSLSQYDLGLSFAALLALVVAFLLDALALLAHEDVLKLFGVLHD